MSNMSQFFGGGVKSVQRGTITVNIAATNALSSATATITAVDPSKSMVSLLGATWPTTQGNLAFSRVDLTNATTVTAFAGSGFTTGNFTIGYQVVEFL